MADKFGTYGYVMDRIKLFPKTWKSDRPECRFKTYWIPVGQGFRNILTFQLPLYGPENRLEFRRNYCPFGQSLSRTAMNTRARNVKTYGISRISIEDIQILMLEYAL